MLSAANHITQRLSVIIPVLDEERCIRGQLQSLLAVPGIHEVIVVDGGSRDRTVELARSVKAGVSVIEASRGRGSQMNAGARVATGDVLLFLHVDVCLPTDAVAHIHAALAEPTVVGGAFRTWTVSDGGHMWLVPFLHLADLRSRYSTLPYGDQAIFVRSEVFRRVGGFPEQPLMEDIEFSRRLRHVGTIRTVPAIVRVSGRRFLARPLYYAIIDNVLPTLYRLGVPPRLLASLYGDQR
jgi:rSAM/selenodomain-associated transferase 2